MEDGGFVCVDDGAGDSDSDGTAACQMQPAGWLSEQTRVDSKREPGPDEIGNVQRCDSQKDLSGNGDGG